MADPEEPRVLTRIWMMMPRKISPGVLRNVALKARFGVEVRGEKG